MIHQVIAVKDVKAGHYAKPVAVPTDAVGVRAFADAVNDSSSEYFKHPEDYEIWNIGTYDDNTGELVASQPRQLANAIALLKPVV